MKLDRLLQQHRQEILEIVRRNGGRSVRVFGSVARGESHAESDVDFLIELEPGRSLLELARMQRELQALLGIPVDVVTAAGLRPRLRESVLQEARPL